MKTRDYNFEGVAKYNYRLVSFGYTEMIIISPSLAGYDPQVYKLDNYSIKQAMQNYHNYIMNKKNK